MDRTAISRKNMDFLTEEDKTPAQIVAFLKEGAMFRQFDQVLRQVYPNEDLAFRLEKGLSEGSKEPSASIARKIRNWLGGRNVPKNRETLFQICFSLGLDERSASRVLGTASDTGIHYRNPEELIYAYGLRMKMNYQETKALKEEIMKCFSFEYRIDGEGKKHPVYTRQIKDAFAQVSDREELMDFFREHGNELGQLHETAYCKFVELLDTLQKPRSFVGEEQKYTVERVMDTYMRMHVPETKQTSDYTLLQRMIKKYWPNESSLLNMRSRKEDVSRKVMLLLYLVTESFDGWDGEEEEDVYFFDVDEEDADTILETRLEKMNLFLDRYGMNGLDAGNPFDFLVLYAMRAEGGECVSSRMEAVLDSLFAME